jgi:hypothetical protein
LVYEGRNLRTSAQFLRVAEHIGKRNLLIHSE